MNGSYTGERSIDAGVALTLLHFPHTFCRMPFY
jgi:hypothetical protein